MLHVALSPQPWRYILSIYGVIDLTAVVFFLVPQINSGVVLWMFKWPHPAGVQAAPLC